MHFKTSAFHLDDSVRTDCKLLKFKSNSKIREMKENLKRRRIEIRNVDLFTSRKNFALFSHINLFLDSLMQIVYVRESFFSSSLEENQLQITPGALKTLIKYYCRESGVRNLQKHIEKVIVRRFFWFLEDKLKQRKSYRQTI